MLKQLNNCDKRGDEASLHVLKRVCVLAQSKSEVKKESGESSPVEAACLCSPAAAKNQCASCGMEIHDRYLLKVRQLFILDFYVLTGNIYSFFCF